MAQGLDLRGREDDPSCGLRCGQCYRSEVRGDAQAGLVLNITTNVEILLVPPVYLCSDCVLGKTVLFISNPNIIFIIIIIN